MKYLYKLAFMVVLGAGFCLAQTGTMGQQPGATPPTFPSGQQQPGAQTANPDQTSPMGQTGTTSTTALTKAQSDIQSALRKQLPASADAVTVSVNDNNKIELKGTVASDTEKKQIEQIARSAAPDQKIENKITVSGTTAAPMPSSPSGMSTSGSPDQNGQQSPLDKNPNTNNPPSGPDKSRQQATPPMAMSFVQGQQSGTEDKHQNQSGTSAQSAGQNPTPSTTESSHYPISNTQTPNSAPEGTSNTANGTSGNTSMAGASDAQSNIQKALQQDPSLANANINVSTKGNKIELTGTVANKDQRKAAKRIAESNAAGFKVVDHIKVEGKGAADQSTNGNPSAPPKY
jgi:osmotically-inducible protein OsmY